MNDKGITLMSIVISVVIIILLSTISINYSLKAIELSNLKNFEANYILIDEKVNVLNIENNIDCSKFRVLDERLNDYKFFYDLLNNPDKYNINTNINWDKESDNNIENYYYFLPEDLDSILGIKSRDMVVIINFDTGNIITKDGVKYNNKIYYRKCDINL